MLIIDATVVPVSGAYPTEINLLNQARKHRPHNALFVRRNFKTYEKWSIRQNVGKSTAYFLGT